MTQKTVKIKSDVKPIQEVIKDFAPIPMPGRFFVARVRKSSIKKKPVPQIMVAGAEQKKQYLEDVYFDHPNQAVVVSVGTDFDRGAGYQEKMVIKKGDVIATHFDDKRPIAILMYEGHPFYELNQSMVLAILGEDPDFEKVE